jgi:hypothetical protein
LSHVMHKVAEAEAVTNVEGNMCGPVMRGTVAPPGSETRSRSQGSRRNLGDLVSGRRAGESAAVRSGKVRSRSQG